MIRWQTRTYRSLLKSCWTEKRTRFSYRCLWVFNNSEPARNWNQWEGSTWWRTHKKFCSSMIILRYQGGNTRWQIKVEVGLRYCSTKDKCLNLHRKWYLKKNMVRTMIAKDQFTDTKGYYIKEIVTRSFHDRIYIVSMGMNTRFKVDSHFSNAYPFIHFSLSMKL